MDFDVENLHIKFDWFKIILEGDRPMFYTTRFGKRNAEFSSNPIEKWNDPEQIKYSDGFQQILEGK